MTRDDRLARIETFRMYWNGLTNETQKKEALKDVLNDLYHDDPDARMVLAAMTAGAETVLRGIPLADRSKTGRADTQFGTVIIEFKADLGKKAMAETAVWELKQYLASNRDAGRTERFTLLATDGRTWRHYTFPYEDTMRPGGLAADVALSEDHAVTLGPGNGDAWFSFIERFVFAQVPQQPTLTLVREQFGERSGLFQAVLTAMEAHYADHAEDPALRVAFEQWQRFLSIAYGASFVNDARVFLVHTYLSVLAKLFAYEVLTGDATVSDGEMAALLTGRFFEGRNVRNFVDDDFFGWIGQDVHRKALASALRAVAAEAARYDFSHVDEDILKGVYQELVDLETRHALGEYYTPDWLCERVMAAFDLPRAAQVLDPACGSGSFLRAAVARMRALHPDLPVEALAGQIVGIDVHPLSVQIAKTTLLLALGADVRAAKRAITLRVYLANTLTIPEGAVQGGLFGASVTVRIDGAPVVLPNALLQDARLFDEGLRVAEELAASTTGGASVTVETISNAVGKRAGGAPSAEVAGALHAVYERFKAAKEAGRDSIWHFLLQNVYRPFTLRKQFDAVVGNPPWLTFNSVTDREYQDQIRALATKGNLLTGKSANMTQLELASVFLTHAATTFLKPGGRIGFVLPRAFFSADQHAPTRTGQTEGVKVTELWDLDGVTPLFPVPACVLFAEQANTAAKRKVPAAGLPGFEASGRLREHNASWDEAKERVTFAPVTWHLATLGRRTAYSTAKPRKGRKENAYRDRFANGATIFPRTFFFTEFAEGVAPPDLEDGRDVALESLVLPEAKDPWKALTVRGTVTSDFLFRTALAQNLLPFALDRTMLTVLPATVGPGGEIALHTASDLRARGDLGAAAWFKQAEAKWDANKTQRNAGMKLVDYLDWHGKLTKQKTTTPYLVLYNSTGKDANAVVVEPGAFDRPFVVDYKAFWYGTEDADEAHYLAAFLNADAPNLMIKDFQSRGLFGARDVNKAILEVPLAAYDGANAAHRKLSEAGREAATEAQAWLSAQVAAAAGEAMPSVGQLRRALRAHLAARLAEIDGLLARA